MSELIKLCEPKFKTDARPEPRQLAQPTASQEERERGVELWARVRAEQAVERMQEHRSRIDWKRTQRSRPVAELMEIAGRWAK